MCSNYTWFTFEGTQGEMQNDEKHRQLVEENEGVFIPLVVERYGLWTPFAKKTLKSIALRTTVRSGLKEKMATRTCSNSCQQNYGAIMKTIILNILSLLPVNPCGTYLKVLFYFLSFRLKKIINK